AEEFGVRVIIQNEAYTSKTCSWCGNVQKIGESEVYTARIVGLQRTEMKMALWESFSGHCLINLDSLQGSCSHTK
ncbi:4998_t:CDS:1, partial [Scutellospora calospora]